MRKFLSSLLKQHDIGQGYGGFINTVSSTAMFVTFFNTLLLVPMAYVTWVKPWTEGKGIYLAFTSFVGLIALSGFIVLLIQYKLLTPSTFFFWNRQFWKHNNPIRQKLNEIEKKMDKRLKSIEEALERIEKEKC